MANMTVTEKITYAKCRLLIRHRLFGGLLLEFPIEETTRPDIDTMATDNVKIMYNKGFVEKLNKNQVMTCLLHELQHILFKHFMRFNIHNSIKNEADRKQLNFALDYAINSIIINEMATKDNLLEFPKGILYDEAFKGMNAEKILSLLKEEQKKNPSKYDQRMQSNAGDFGQFDNHGASSEMTGDGVASTKKKTGKSLQDQMNDIDKKIFKTASSLREKEKGDVPAEIQRLIDEYMEELEGHINWKRFIKRKIQEIGRGQYTTAKVNRAYLPYGLYLPGQTGSKAKVALALDTSGSISQEDIIEFVGELKSMLRMMPFLEIILYGCDSIIHGKTRIKGLKNFRNDVNKVLTGGGGTSFIPVFEDLAKHKDKDIKALFYFTDGYGDQNQIEQAVGKFNWETFWVLQKGNREIEFPFGQKIIMWNDEKERE
jgi:predicted metal-dependent peptidase